MREFLLLGPAWQPVHGVNLYSHFNLLRLSDIFEYVCRHGIGILQHSASVLLLPKDRRSCPIQLLDGISFGAYLPDVERFVYFNGTGIARAWLPEYAYFTDTLTRIRMYKAIRMKGLQYQWKQELARADLLLSCEIAEWLAWSPLPEEMCDIIAEYLHPADDWFERRLEHVLQML